MLTASPITAHGDGIEEYTIYVPRAIFLDKVFLIMHSWGHPVSSAILRLGNIVISVSPRGRYYRSVPETGANRFAPLCFPCKGVRFLDVLAVYLLHGLALPTVMVDIAEFAKTVVTLSAIDLATAV